MSWKPGDNRTPELRINEYSDGSATVIQYNPNSATGYTKTLFYQMEWDKLKQLKAAVLDGKRSERFS